MANQVNNVLREFVTNVRQLPEWDQSGTEKQMVTAYFKTPSGFTGQVKMSLDDWSDPETRGGKVIEAMANLDWEFAEALEAQPKKGK